MTMQPSPLTPQPCSHEVRHEVRRKVVSAEEATRLKRLLQEGAAEALRRFEDGEQPCISISEGLADFLSWQRVQYGNAAATLAAYRRRLLGFAEAWGDVPLSSITRDMVFAWSEARLRQPGRRRRYHLDAKISRDTVNNDLKALRYFSTWASSTGRAPDFLELKQAPLLSVRGKLSGNRFVPKARVRHDLLRIVRAVERAGYTHLAYVLEGMQLFLLREEALFQLTLRHVTWPTRSSAGMLDVPPLKGGPEGGIPIPFGSERHDLLKALVAFWRRQHRRTPRKDDPLFATRRARSRRRPYGWSTDAFDHELRRVCDRLGFHDFTAYQARHSVITWLQQQPGVSLADIQAAARHLRITTQEVYSHRSGRDGQSAYEAVERYVRGQADALSGAVRGNPADRAGGRSTCDLQPLVLAEA